MIASTRHFLAVTALVVAGCASAERAPAPAARTADEQAVIAVVDALFDAMRTRDTAAIRRLSHPELRLYVPGVQNGEPVTRVSTLAQFISSIAREGPVQDERAYDPEVRIDGGLASVWTYYDFHRGQEFSHCGHDAFHLARTPAGWQITALAYTIVQAGCRGR